MKAPTIAVICLACSLVAAGVAAMLMHALDKPSERPFIAHHSADDPELTLEIDALREEVASIREELRDLRDMPAPEPVIIYQDSPDPDEDSIPEPEIVASATGDDLYERVERLESSSEAARKLRLQASLELSSSNGRVRRNAADLLCKLARDGDSEALSILVQAMQDDNHSVRITVAESVGAQKLVQMIPALRAAAADPHSTVRHRVARALGRMPPEEAGPILLTMLNEQNSGVIRAAIDSLGTIDYQGARGELSGLVQHNDVNIAMRAALAMRRLGDESAAAGLAVRLGSTLYSGSVNERRTTVRNLRTLNTETARPYFEQALRDTDSRVRRYAQHGINSLNRARQ